MLCLIFLVLLGLITPSLATALSAGNVDKVHQRRDVLDNKMEDRSLRGMLQRYSIYCIVDKTKINGVRDGNHYPNNAFCRKYLDCNWDATIFSKGDLPRPKSTT